MEELVKQEQFELEVLDRLKTGKALNGLVFGGGTMLRLCHGLNRFSVDLDFQISDESSVSTVRKKIEDSLRSYEIRDAADKFHTLLFEIKSASFPRSLKIEVRKEKKIGLPEHSIAFSRFSNLQVLLNTVPLNDMMASKIAALTDREEIRDAFDIEFLLKKGIELKATMEKLDKARKIILGFGKHDYTAKLGPLLDAGQRYYYTTENFKILIMAIESLNQ